MGKKLMMDCGLDSARDFGLESARDSKLDSALDSTLDSMADSTLDSTHGVESKLDSILNIFYEIAKIPHPSANTADLQRFIIDFLKQCDCKVKVDGAGNIYALKGAPKFAFQAHYDMVLVGEKIEPFIENGFLKSRNSSLGADNGAAIALLLHLAKRTKNFEILLTNDEEIGMIGAKNLRFQTQSKMMINLDSECANEICVGCAGGFDADISISEFLQDFANPQIENGDFANLKSENICDFANLKSDSALKIYEFSAHNFKGGHSGIDIHKNIKNAIVELLFALDSASEKFEILEISGGEARNSIPINARAIIATSANIPNIAPRDDSTPHIAIKKLTSAPKILQKSTPQKSLKRAVVAHLLRLHNGIYEMENGSVLCSLNFSQISQNALKIMVRANRAELLERAILRLKYLFGGGIKISGFYDAWEENIAESSLFNALCATYKKHKIPFRPVQIHAGLECGILKQKCALSEVLSIGPTILYPHSKGEMMDLKSFERFCAVVEDLC